VKGEGGKGKNIVPPAKGREKGREKVGVAPPKKKGGGNQGGEDVCWLWHPYLKANYPGEEGKQELCVPNPAEKMGLFGAGQEGEEKRGRTRASPS